jgi:cutinase
VSPMSHSQVAMLIFITPVSQGTACMHRAIPKLSAAVQAKIAGVVLFGDTQATQTGRKIQGLSADKVKIICNASDAVCGGSLVITTAHFQYTPHVAPATQFLIERIDANKKGGAAPAAAGEE